MKRSTLVLSVALLALPVAAQAQYLSQPSSSFPVGPPTAQDVYNESQRFEGEQREQALKNQVDELQKRLDDQRWRSYGSR